MSLQKALAEIQGRIRASSSGQFVELVAVSKTFGPPEIQNAYDLGLKHFGENKVQELLEKQALLPADIRWHMIGRLQTNKVRDLVGKTALIHSLDRVDLFEKLESEANKQGIVRLECLLQVNISGEKTKAGFSPNDAEKFLSRIQPASPVKIMGLMTMAPLTENPNEAAVVFREAKMLFEKWKHNYPQFEWKHLSMGMSGDYEVAVREGATMVRIGTALFGSREKK